ncbi:MULTISPECIES: hypothetical protein [unclassified Streptomyces]|uniref:hypothetical protein n=1 Tax=unclassified Streptomyces TaxID=2593676 RepID=UPI002E77632F|nr:MULTISPECIES: hypothetical protein [unclassified Streptomyces]MEE1758662.1 hypothetical protein [Streptomyces sp. SP18BB07]MEE1831023.1 hypothetical protein [Streptomyces sp. SP17KL33]
MPLFRYELLHQIAVRALKTGAPTFRRLVTTAGVGADAPTPPRLHDLRHTFAVRALLTWYRTGGDIQA